MLIASLDSLQLPTTSHLEKSSYGQLYLDLLYRHLNYFYPDSHRRRLHFETKSGYYSTLCFFVQGISPIGFSSSVCVKYFRYVCMIFVKIADILFFISQKFGAFVLRTQNNYIIILFLIDIHVLIFLRRNYILSRLLIERHPPTPLDN